MQAYELSFHIYSILVNRISRYISNIQLKTYKINQGLIEYTHTMLTQRPNIWLWTIWYIGQKLRTHIAWSSHNLSCYEAWSKTKDNYKKSCISWSIYRLHYLQRKQDHLRSTFWQVQNHLLHHWSLVRKPRITYGRTIEMIRSLTQTYVAIFCQEYIWALKESWNAISTK